MTASNIQTIDLAHIRETCPTPTSDVKFTFVDQNSGEKSELLAHKLVLAFGSEVFMAQFYGPFKEERDTIPVEDSSFDAFKMLLDLLYNKKVIFENLDFQLLGDLFNLANKFLLDEIKDSIIQEISSRKMVSEKLLEAATVAEDQAHMERFSEALSEVCVKFVKENIQSVFKIFDSEAPGGDNSLILHRLMAKGNRIQNVCENCKHEPCLHDQVLTRDNFVIKAKIRRETTRGTGHLDYRETVRFIDNADNNDSDNDGSDQVEYENKLKGSSFIVPISEVKYKCKG